MEIGADIHHAATLLNAGQLVAMPTETVYGLAGDATNDRAVAAIFAMKGRPSFNPLIVHVRNADAACKLVEWNEMAECLAEAFWPGALTLILPRRADSPVSLLASAGLDTVAVRSPAHPLARQLLKASGLPLAAPSANRSGRVSPTAAAHVTAEFPDAPLYILDGGACKVGVESTVVDLTGDRPVILRPGSVTEEMVTRHCEQSEAIQNLSCGTNWIASASPFAKSSGDRLSRNDGNKIKAPGMMTSHYAPSIPVRLNVEDVKPGEALLAFGVAIPGAMETLNLSKRGDVQEAAANLFAYLRALDNLKFTAIAVMPVPEVGIGLAINDRLRRAAA